MNRSLKVCSIVVLALPVFWLALRVYARPIIGGLAIQDNSGRLMYAFGYWSREGDWLNPLFPMLAGMVCAIPPVVASLLSRPGLDASAKEQHDLYAKIFVGMAAVCLGVGIALMILRFAV